MQVALIWALFSQTAFAAEMIMSPGGVVVEGFDGDEQLMWTDWATECSCQVLDLPKDAETPVQIKAIRIGLGSQDGRWDHNATSVAVGLKRLDDGAVPTKLPGIKEWDWPETWFEMSVSSDHLTEIPMDNLLPPTWALSMDGGRLAVFVCGTDPNLALPWPTDETTGEASGLIIDPDLPGSDSYLWVSPEMRTLSDLGIDGGWVIQAVAIDDRAETPSGFELSAITPGSTTIGTVAELELSGSGFDDGVVVTIGGLNVVDIALVDSETLSGRSPSGLPLGSHDVLAMSTDGDESLLTTAFTVTDLVDTVDSGADSDVDPDGSGSGSGSGCGACSQAATSSPPGGGPAAALLMAALGLVGLRRRRGNVLGG